MFRILSRIGSGGDTIDAMKALIPTPAQAMPPGVGVGGAKGAQTTAYALADHTHATSVQRNRVAITLAGSTGRGPLTFARPYADGVIPTVILTAETPDANGYFYDARILAGSVTNTGCVVVVNKVNQTATLGNSLANLLNAVVNIFAPATGTATVHYAAGLTTATT